MKTLHLIATALAVSALMLPAAYAKGVSNTTVNFVKNATIGGTFEVESSQLALNRSKNDNVKAFAQQMVDDHTKTSEELKATVSKAGLDESLTDIDLDDKHQDMLDKLDNASDADFDMEYAKAQVAAHKEAVSLFSNYAKKGDNAALKRFAAKTLPTLKTHLQHVKELK